MNQIKDIALEDIIRDKSQPRKYFGKEELDELADSIKKHGLLQPIIVSRDLESGKYVIIAGERRYRASVIAGKKTIKALIRSVDDKSEIALIENLQRKDLNKIEEANAIQAIMKEKKYTQDQVAQILSKSRPYISNILRLLKLSPHIQKALIDEKISDAHARVLAGIKEENKKQILLQKIINEKISVRETEQWSKGQKEKKDIFLIKALEELENNLGTKIYTKGSKRSGTLCINYHSESELGDIIEKILDTFK